MMTKCPCQREEVLTHHSEDMTCPRLRSDVGVKRTLTLDEDEDDGEEFVPQPDKIAAGYADDGMRAAKRYAFP
jgi:hypothetical protein